MPTLETLIPSSTDGELLTLWSTHKNSHALEILVERHGRLVYSLCHKLLRNPPEIEDGFQTVFLLLTQHAHQIRRRESVASWLYSVTVRVCKRISQARSRAAASLPENIPASTPMSFSQVEFHETSELLARELERLPEKLREPLVLVYLEGHSRASVAELLNTTEDGIKCRLTRGRKMLRSRLLKRGVTFAIAFTASSSMIAEAATEATVAVPTALLKGTIASCQAGKLLAPLSSTSVSLSSLESITMLKQGALMTSTAWQTLAVTTAVALVIAIGGSSASYGDHTSHGQKSVNFDVGDSAYSPMLNVDSVKATFSGETPQEEQSVIINEPSLGIVTPDSMETDQVFREDLTVVDFTGESVFPFNEKPAGERVDVYRMPPDAHALRKPIPRKLYNGIEAIYDSQAQVLKLRAESLNHQQAQLDDQEQNPLIVVPHGVPLSRVLAAVQQNGLTVARAPVIQQVTSEVLMGPDAVADGRIGVDQVTDLQQAEETARLLQAEADNLKLQAAETEARMAELLTQIVAHQAEAIAQPQPTERAPIAQAEMQNQVYALHDQSPLFAAVSNHSLADIERQRLVKLMDTVSQKQLDLELQHDELVLAGEGDEHRLNKLKQMIEIHKKKLDDFRNEYRLIDQPSAPPEAPAAAAWTPAVQAEQAAAPPEVQPFLAVAVDQPADQAPYVQRGDAIELQLKSELPVKVHQHPIPYAIDNPDTEWHRIDQEAPMKLSVFPSDSKQYELKVNRVGAPKMATLRIRPDIQEELREKLQNFEITLTRKDLDQLNANQPVVKTFSATGKSGEYKGVDTEFTWDIKTENASEHEIHDRVLHMMAHETPDQNNQPIIWGVLIIEAGQPGGPIGLFAPAGAVGR